MARCAEAMRPLLGGESVSCTLRCGVIDDTALSISISISIIFAVRL